MPRRRSTRLTPVGAPTTVKPTNVQWGKPGSFQPFEPETKPPPGFYDPAIDAQERASGRGWADLQKDLDKAAERAGLTYKGNLAQLMTSRTRANEDYGTRVEDLTLNYGRLAASQAQGRAQRGVLSSGIARQAAQVRDRNFQHDKAPLDTALARFLSDNTDAEKRLDQDFLWNKEDRSTQYVRGGREHVAFGEDANAQRWFGAQQMGYQAPTAPRNEIKSPSGQTYRRIRSRGVIYYVLPDGTRLRKAPA